MKTLATLFTLMFFLVAAPLFSQENKEKAKEPIRPALLVIDIQNAFLPMIPEQDKLMGMEYINGLIDLFRKNNFPVIRVYQYSEEYGVTPGKTEFEFPETVKILPTDPKVVKNYGDGFHKTDLDKVIRESGSNTLFLCGLSAVGCVLATWNGAQNHDYRAFMVKNAIMSHNTEYTRDIEVIFDAVGYDVVKLIVENASAGK